MDDIQAKAIFKLSTPDIKKSVRAFLTKHKNSQRSELTNSFSELYHDISLQLHTIDAAYKERCGQKVSRVTYKQVVALAWGMAPKCKGCGEPSINCLPTNPGSGVFRKEYCSHKCLNTSEHAWAKRRATTTERYGTDNYYASKDFAKRMPEILSEKYGMSVVNPSQVPSIQAKKIKTSLRKRGVAHHMQDSKFRETQAKADMFTPGSYNRMRVKALQEYANKTGYSNPLSDPGVQAKVAATNIKKYGTPNPSNSDQVRRKIARSNASENTQQKYQATSMKNHGTKFPNQSPHVSRKAVGKRFTLVECLGRTLKLEGVEPVVAKYLESLGSIKSVVVPLSKIPYVSETGKHRTYNPDLAVVGRSGKRYLVECKEPRGLWAEGFMGSTNLYKLKALERYCKERGYTPLLIMVNKQNSIEFRRVEVIQNPVAWMEEATRQKLEGALLSNPELVPSQLR